MKYSTQYNRLERLTISLDDNDIREAIIEYVRRVGKTFGVPQAKYPKIEFEDVWEDDEPTGRYAVELVWEFEEELEKEKKKP